MTEPVDTTAQAPDSNDEISNAGRSITSQKGSAITRVLEILEAVATAERPVTPTELSETLNIPKATIHRLCATLESQGFLQTRLSGRGLLPGHRFHRSALGVLASSPYRAQRHAILTNLSHEIGETCNISIPDGSEMIYFDRAETHWPVRIQLQVGSRVPAYSTASGKMYLSSLPTTKRQRILTNTHLLPHTQNTITVLEELETELALTKSRGFSADNEEYIEGMVAMAVPITDRQDRLYATVSFHAPIMRVPFESLTSYLPVLQNAGIQLSELFDE